MLTVYNEIRGFWWDEEDNYFTREAEIIDIVYDLDKNKLRTFTLESDIN